MAAATTQVKILVPGHQSMVALLGQQDAFLKLIEAAFSSDILVRGNEITITGPDHEAEQLARLFEELLALLEKGHNLSDSSVGQTIELIKGGVGERRRRGDPDAPSEVLGDTLLTARGTSVAPKTVGQKRFVDAMRAIHRDLRDRPGGHWQDLPRRRHRGAGPPRSSGLEADPHATGGRGGGAARVPAGDALREDRSVHASRSTTPCSR